MQVCSKCHHSNPDTVTYCENCEADLREFSNTAIALQRMQKNPRIRYVRISVAHDACPACMELQGTYPKEEVPVLPVEGCSHGLGCRCMYEPVLEEIYP